MSNVLQEFAAFLRERKSSVVRSRDVLVERWDPTYGRQDPGTETIDVIDFERLLEEMDAFGEVLRTRGK